MRGRLIQIFYAEIMRLDSSAIDSNNEYDDVFRQIIPTDSNGDGIGTPVRREMAAIKIPCQIDQGIMDQIQKNELGINLNADIELTFHYEDLENLDLLDPNTNRALIDVGDRLNSIYDINDNLVWQIKTPPGLYITEAKDEGFGIFMVQPTRNLLTVRLGEKPVIG